MGKTLLIFSAQYLPHMGGVEFFTAELAKRLVADGHRVVVVTSETADAPDYECDLSGFEVYRLPSWALLDGRLPVPRLGRRRKEMLAHLASISVDGVLVNTRFYPHSLTGVRLGARLGVPTVVLDHGSNYVTFGSVALDLPVHFYERLMTGLLKYSGPKFYGISEASCQWLRALGLEPSGVIPNAIDATRFRACASDRSFRRELNLQADVKLVVYTGRLIPEKGVGAIVEAASMLDASGCRVHFVLAGEGPLFEGLHRVAPSNLSIVGRLNQSDISALLQESDIFLFPSRSEGFGSSLLEAAICGNAIVSTKVGIAPQLIGAGEGGAYLSSASALEIKNALEGLLGNEAVRLAKGETVRWRGEHLFSWDETCNALLCALS